MAFSTIAYAEAPAENGARTMDAMYLLGGSIDMIRRNGELNVLVTTSANTYADYVYHDIAVYKNGVRISWDRYYKYNVLDNITSLSFSAQTGDRFEVVVDHYVEHMGVYETRSSSHSMIY